MVFGLVVLAALSPMQERDRPVFRISTEAVQADVFVEQDGRAAVGLNASDFELLDDGVPRKIDSVAVAEIPVNVVLVLDISGSVKGATLTHLRLAATAFLDELAPRDRAALITFSNNLSLSSGLSADVAPMKRVLEEVEAAGGTAWQDALFCALELLEVVRERPLVLLFTDGADTYSWVPEEQVIPLVSRSNAVVYAITRSDIPPLLDLRTNREQQRYLRSRDEHASRVRLLREVTRESGGRLIETESADELQKTFLTILAEMKTRYVLTFSPEAPVREGWHELEVKVKRKGVEVHARRGYYYEARH
ncbi:MAG TPA: VWA domain-containing protein [Vicinamibacteria bacterium]|jgi:VWFA-related protein